MFLKGICWAAVATLVPFAIIFVYCHPSIDDYAIADIVAEHGFWGGQAQIYRLWIGRYTSNALVMAAGIHPDFSARLVPILLLVLFPLSMWRFIHVSWGLIYRYVRTDRDAQSVPSAAILNRPNMKQSFWLSLIVTAFYVTRAPSVTQAFYWWSGSLTYTVGLCLALLLFASLVSHSKSKTVASRVGNGIVCGLLTAAAIGSNETIMALIDASLLLVCVVLLRERSRRAAFWCAVLAVAFIGSLFDYFAPGTQARMAAMPEGHQFVHSVTHSLFHMAKHLAIWSADPALWCASIIAVPFLLSLHGNLRNKSGVSLPRLRVVYFLWFLAHFATVFPPYWAMGHGPPDRALNITYMVFLIGWSISLFVLISNVSETWRDRLTQPKWQLRAAVAFMFCLPLIGNWPFAVYDVLYAAPNYHREWLARYEAQVEQLNHGIRHAMLRPIESHPTTIFYGDISNDAAEWTNQAYASFYGFESVELRPQESTALEVQDVPENIDGKVPKNARRVEFFRSSNDSRAERR